MRFRSRRYGRRKRDPAVARIPLVRLNVDDTPGDIYLKLENLQPIGSFKLRGAGNAMALADPDALAGGVYTASAGNMAQGLACVSPLFARCLYDSMLELDERHPVLAAPLQQEFPVAGS